MNNIATDFLRAYTKEEDPEAWPGAHGRVYVDYLPADKSLKEDGTRLFTDEMLEQIRQRYVQTGGMVGVAALALFADSDSWIGRVNNKVLGFATKLIFKG